MFFDRGIAEEQSLRCMGSGENSQNDKLRDKDKESKEAAAC